MNRQKITTIVLRRTGYITDLCNSSLRLLSLHGKSNRFNGRLCPARCGRRSRIQRLQGRNCFNSRSYGRIYNRLYRYGGHQRNRIQKYARKVPCTAQNSNGHLRRCRLPYLRICTVRSRCRQGSLNELPACIRSLSYKGYSKRNSRILCRSRNLKGSEKNRLCPKRTGVIAINL